MPHVKDGTYKLFLSVDAYAGIGTLTMVANSGQGHGGKFTIEVHVNSDVTDFRGILNVIPTGGVVPDDPVMQHFSLGVVGSIGDDRFDLIGRGPREIIVEIDAIWLR